MECVCGEFRREGEVVVVVAGFDRESGWEYSDIRKDAEHVGKWSGMFREWVGGEGGGGWGREGWAMADHIKLVGVFCDLRYRL